MRTIQEVEADLAGEGFDYVRFEQPDLHGMSRSKTVPARHFGHYAERGLTYLEPTADEVARVEDLGVRAVTAPVIDKWSGPRDLWLKQDTIRHDAARVATALLRLVDERRPRLRALP